MNTDEMIILPLPSTIVEMIQAADAYLDQYGVVAQLQLRGRIMLEGGQVARLSAWRTIARFDRELGLVGLGDRSELDEMDEDLLWVYPLGGELKVVAREEEM